MSWIRLGAQVVSITLACAAAAQKTTILVPLDPQPTWRDFAFLSAVVAAKNIDPAGGSVIALEPNGQIGPEIRDFFRRFNPVRIVNVEDSLHTVKLASLPPMKSKTDSVKATGAEEAAIKLSRLGWRAAQTAIICEDNDYDSALLAAPLAGLLRSPLLYTSKGKLSPAALAELKQLGVKRIISVGTKSAGFPNEVIPLASATEIMNWTKAQKLKVSYLAAVNPTDRGNYATRKLSLVGAQLAVGRGGLVAPLKYAVEWKRGFASKAVSGGPGRRIPKSNIPAKQGTIEIGNTKLPYILAGDSPEHGLRLFIESGGKLAKPLVSGDTIEIDGKRWAISLGNRTKFGNTDVHVSWPTAQDLTQRLEAYYNVLGAPPKSLCLVGFPDALPHAIFGRGSVVEEQASDLPFAQYKNSDFAQIGVGRVIAENVSFGSLYAARVLNYDRLNNAEWARQAGMAEWENTLGPLFQNVGFKQPYQMTSNDVPWKVAPTNNSGGTRASSFAESSPLTRSAVLTHSSHSSWQGLGEMFNWDANVLLSPTVVESGGCGTACLDREADNRSVVARLLRLGAVSFAGGSRELPAQAQPLRMEFWNAVLAGQTLGEASKRALNAGLLVARNNNEGPEGAYQYCTQVRIQFGDPALALKVPTAPLSAPAKTELRGKTVSVYAPEKWTPVKAVVPPDWKQWANKDLFVVRGAGAFSMSNWMGEGRDEEIPLVMAEFTTASRVTQIIPQTTTKAPLGWSGKWFCTQNPDGSFTTRFTVRMIDFDQVKGKILATVDRLDFKVETE